MTTPVVVLDTGVIEQVATNPEFRQLVRELVARGWDPVVPTVVLAEAVTGRPVDANVNRTVKRVGTVDTPPAIARHAGQLRFEVLRARPERKLGGIDAIVAAHAADAGSGVVFTSDPTDLRRLLADHPHLSVERP